MDGENFGGRAIYGSFAVSGYLITGSRWTGSLGTYLVHRIVRIFRAFLVCLVVMTVAFAPIGYLRLHGNLTGFITAGPTTPANSIFSNSLLRVSSYEIAGTPGKVPYPGSWNGSLWTLYYEFLCYLIVGALAVIGFVRRSPWRIGIVFVGSAVAHATWSRIAGPLLGGNGDTPPIDPEHA